MESSPTPEKKSISQLDKIGLITKMNQLWELYGTEDEPAFFSTDTDSAIIRNLHSEFCVDGTYISLTENTEEYLELGAEEPTVDTQVHIRVATPLPYDEHTYWNVDHFSINSASHAPRLISDETNDKGWWKDYHVSIGRVEPFTNSELDRLMYLLEKIQPAQALAEVPEVFRQHDFWAEQA